MFGTLYMLALVQYGMVLIIDYLYWVTKASYFPLPPGFALVFPVALEIGMAYWFLSKLSAFDNRPQIWIVTTAAVSWPFVHYVCLILAARRRRGRRERGTSVTLVERDRRLMARVMGDLLVLRYERRVRAYAEAASIASRRASTGRQ